MTKDQVDTIIANIRNQQETVDRNYIRAYNQPISLESEWTIASCEAWYYETIDYIEELKEKWC
jgi:hypothetical protein